MEELKPTKRYHRNPIDHGYAWFIVLAAGLAFFIGDGMLKSFTFVYEELLSKFEGSATKTALVDSLYGCVLMCSSKFCVTKMGVK